MFQTAPFFSQAILLYLVLRTRFAVFWGTFIRMEATFIVTSPLSNYRHQDSSNWPFLELLDHFSGPLSDQTEFFKLNELIFYCFLSLLIGSISSYLSYYLLINYFTSSSLWLFQEISYFCPYFTVSELANSTTSFTDFFVQESLVSMDIKVIYWQLLVSFDDLLPLALLPSASLQPCLVAWMLSSWSPGSDLMLRSSATCLSSLIKNPLW